MRPTHRHRYTINIKRHGHTYIPPPPDPLFPILCILTTKGHRHLGDQCGDPSPLCGRGGHRVSAVRVAGGRGGDEDGDGWLVASGN
jgi:hypothetical protein